MPRSSHIRRILNDPQAAPELVDAYRQKLELSGAIGNMEDAHRNKYLRILAQAYSDGLISENVYKEFKSKSNDLRSRAEGLILIEETRTTLEKLFAMVDSAYSSNIITHREQEDPMSLANHNPEQVFDAIMSIKTIERIVFAQRNYPKLTSVLTLSHQYPLLTSDASVTGPECFPRKAFIQQQLPEAPVNDKNLGYRELMRDDL